MTLLRRKRRKEKGPAQQQSQREGPSKKELNKLKAKEAKEKAIAAKKAAEGKVQGGSNGKDASVKVETENNPALAALYGDSPMIRSETITEKSYKDISDIPAWVNQEIWIRGRLHTSRAVSKGAFFSHAPGIEHGSGHCLAK